MKKMSFESPVDSSPIHNDTQINPRSNLSDWQPDAVLAASATLRHLPDADDPFEELYRVIESARTFA